MEKIQSDSTNLTNKNLTVRAAKQIYFSKNFVSFSSAPMREEKKLEMDKTSNWL